jgi:hypothetical protein
VLPTQIQKTLNKLDLKNAIKLSPKFTGTLFVNTNVAGGKLNLTITCGEAGRRFLSFSWYAVTFLSD